MTPPPTNLRTVIRNRRDGRRQSRSEFDALCRAAADKSAPDYQIAAWLMAAYLRPLDRNEAADLTLAMAESGERIDLSGLPKPWVDKHSTGGVGDKTTIVLLPLLAACGLTMVKMSGRGLGITGGTIDKLESLPGFRTDLSIEEMKAQAGEIGLALTGQTPRLAPADGALYALRDVTETVDSIPLIVSSILSKKIAGGADTVLLDVKCGSGAFMTTVDAARELAEWLEEVGTKAGLNIGIEISDMSAPLGRTAGNALEIIEACEVLAGGELSGPTARFDALCRHFGAEALVKSGVCGLPEAERRISEAIASGAAKAKAQAWFAAQGCTVDPFSTPFPSAAYGADVAAPLSGWIARIEARAVGEAVLSLGGGRRTKADTIDHSVGVETLVSVGDPIGAGAPVFRVHAASEAAFAAVRPGLEEGLTISESPVEPEPLFL